MLIGWLGAGVAASMGAAGYSKADQEAAVLSGEITVRASGSEDLAQPLQQAFARAVTAGARRFTLTIAPGKYREFALSLRDDRDADGMELVVAGEGDIPVVLDSVALQLAADRVIVRNLVLRGNRRPAAVLDVRVATEFTGERLALIDNECQDPTGTEPLARLAASGHRGATARATLRHAWLIGNRVEGRAPLLATPRTGRADLAELRLEGCVFSGNAATHALEPWFTRQTAITNCLLAEHRSAGAWLRLVSPLARVRLEGGVIANAGALVLYETGPDVSRTDFAAVEAVSVELHLPDAPDSAELHCRDCVLIPSPVRPFDPIALAQFACQGRIPDPAMLRRMISPP
ncbi:MAG TPA: hypothetical protein PLY66_13185 [Acidobacteriota bacterium]|nr:hypothetical protein [Acidobacteriota bacterium]HQF85933.1 hypothetical protein [Acidobacteriota bacterium]HQG90823.1 hypothetical protein [Acidobacteriota bacterium]HQK86178.1 hypothetical protein [Acidobacteriota bacterium]